MTILVTGATGFVGSAIVRKLRARGEKVRVLVRGGSDRANLAGQEVDYATGDLLDPHSLAQAARGAAAVYHVAADYRLWSSDDRAIYDVNVNGTENVLRAAAEAGAERIVYTSSVCTLGLTRNGVPANEETPVSISAMVGAYKTSKFLAENVARDWATRGAPVIIVNPSTPIGPGDVKPTPTGRMIRDAMLGRMPAFVDTGLNFVHVDDVAEGHILAHDRGRVGERYVLGGSNLSLRAMLELIAQLMGRTPPQIALPRRLLYPIALAAEVVARVTGEEPLVTVNGLRLAKKHMYFSSMKAEAELGYAARPVREAVRDAIVWFGAALPDLDFSAACPPLASA